VLPTPPSVRTPIPRDTLVPFSGRDELPYLPVPFNAFIGREREIAALGSLP